MGDVDGVLAGIAVPDGDGVATGLTVPDVGAGPKTLDPGEALGTDVVSAGDEAGVGEGLANAFALA